MKPNDNRSRRRTLGQSRLTTGGLAKDLGAAGADDDGLCVGEDGGDGEAAGALDVHEEGARAGHECLLHVRCVCAEIELSVAGHTLSLCLRASA